MKGLRAFGRNQGSLGHYGDFKMLFSPLLPRLEDVAAFGPELTFSALYGADAPENWEQLEAEASVALEQLDLRTAETRKARPETYYGPGFFPQFASFVVDDWNKILCFKPPFPEFSWIFDRVYTKTRPRGLNDPEYDATLRAQFQSLGFYLWFRNIDACWWECYAPDSELIAEVRAHLVAWKIDFEDLDFNQDFPAGGLKKEREFRGVHKIWPA